MADYKGLTIKFEGDATDLSAALHTISQKARDAENELVGINRALKFDTKNPEVLGQKVRESANHVDALKQRVDALRQGMQECESVLNISDHALERLTEEFGEESDIVRQAKEEIEHFKRAHADAKDEVERLEAQIRKETERLKALETQFEASKTALYRFGTSAEELGSSMVGLGDALMPLATRLTAITTGVGLVFGRQVINNTEDFGNAISQVGGYLGITGDELERMEELALYWGKETQYSATEAAQAMSELAKGGLTPAEISGGALETTMHLAAAGQLDLASAATTTVQAMRAFGLSAEDTTEVADALAGAAANSTTTVEGLAGGFRYVAGWSRLAEWDIHEVAGALGLLADYGLTGEMAGTALRNVLMRLAAPTDKARGIMEEYGIEVRDANGEMKSAVEIVEELQGAFDGVDKDERDAALNTMFGARGINAASALIDAGADSLQEYIGYTEEAGAATELAQAQMGELGWALEYLRGEAETASVNLGNALTPMLVDLAGHAEDALSWFNDLGEEGQLEIANIIVKALAAGPVLLGVATALRGVGSGLMGLGRFTQGVSAFAASAGKAETLAGRLGLAMAGMSGNVAKVGEYTATATAGLFALQAAAVVALVAVTGLLIYNHWRDLEDARRRTEKVNTALGSLTAACGDSGRAVNDMADDFDDALKSADELHDEIEDLADAHIDFAESVRDQNRELSTNLNGLDEARDTVLNYLDDVNSGVELSAEQQGELTTALRVLSDQFGITFSASENGITYFNEEGEEVAATRDLVYELCDAKKYEMQLNAYSSRYSDIYAKRAEYEEDRAQAIQDAAAAESELQRLKDMETDEGWRSEFSSEWAYDRAVVEAEEALDAANAKVAELDGMLEDVNGSLSDTEYELGAVDAQANGMDLSLGQWAALDERLRQSAIGHLADFGNALDDVGIDADKMREILQGLSDDQLVTLNSQFDGSSESIRNSLGLMLHDSELLSDGWQNAIDMLGRSELQVSPEDALNAIAQGIEDGTISISEAGGGLYQTLYDIFSEPEAREVGKSAAKGITSGMADNLFTTKDEQRALARARQFTNTMGNAFYRRIGQTAQDEVQRSWNELWSDDAMTEAEGSIVNGAKAAGVKAGTAMAEGIFDGVKDKALAQKAAEDMEREFFFGLHRAAPEEGESIVGGIGEGMKRINLLPTIRRQITSPVSDGLQKVSGKSSNWGRALTANFSAGMGRVSIAAKASSVMSGTSSQMQKYNSQSLTWGYHLVSNFAAGMNLASGKVSAAVDSITSKISRDLKHSVPQSGPLRDDDVWGLHLGQNFASGMMDSLPEIERASLAMADAVQQPILDYGFDDGAFLTDVADNVRANQQVNIYFNDVNVNDYPAIRGAFVNLMYEVNRAGVMQGGRR